MTTRYQQLIQWLTQLHGNITYDLLPLAGDASFRRYYRLELPEQSYIVMDAPPTQESCEGFAHLARLFARYDIPVPHIFAEDLAQGFLLLSDFGDELLLKKLNMDTADALYDKALKVLIEWQAMSSHLAPLALPTFDEHLIFTELARFREWYVERHLKKTLTAAQERILKDSFQGIIQRFLKIPTVCVHRDYHSRNLLLLPNQAIGIIDFQDAVWGPITYDLVSLLRDCYIRWPQDQVISWVLKFKELLIAQNILRECSDATFIEWFDWVSVQRHLKIVGIFARLKERDGKEGYLRDIPLAYHYLLTVCDSYRELQPLRELLLELAPQNYPMVAT